MLLTAACTPVAAADESARATPPTATATEIPPTATASPPPTDTLTPAPPTSTWTPSPTYTPSATHTSLPIVTLFPSPTPRPTVSPLTLPVPPPIGQGQDHLWFGRPFAGGVISPSSSYRFGSTYGGRLQTHHGVDLGNPMGTPAIAVGPGTVLYAAPDIEVEFGPSPDFYGNVVVLQMAETWNGHPVFALYGHLSEILIQPGQPVKAGDMLGLVGASGVALGAHLHFEIRLDNPQSYWDVYNPEMWWAPLPGSGVLAIRVVGADGRYLPGVRVGLTCADGVYRFVDTYWDNGVNPDSSWGENGALTDISAGQCTAETRLFGETVRESVVVEAGRTAFLLLAAGR